MTSQMTRTYLLAQVPENVIENPDNLKPDQLHIGRYNVAVWLNFSVIGQGPIRLMLKYTDQQSDHLVEVDRVEPGMPGQVLLSGVALLKCKGPIQSIQVLASTKVRALEFRIEEAYVQRQSEDQARLTFEELRLGQKKAS